MTETENISIIRGVDFKSSIIITQQTSTEIWDLSEYSVRGHIRETVDSPTKLAELTCVISSIPLGKIDISLSKEISANILPLPTSNNPQRFV